MSGSRENLMSSRWQDGLPHPIAFVFSGGAGLGAIQVGMLQALATVKLQPDRQVAARYSRRYVGWGSQWSHGGAAGSG
jgi:peptide deformylase